MLVSTYQLKQCQIQAVDGELGRAEDFFVYQGEWSLSHCLVQTPLLIEGKGILLPATTFRKLDRRKYILFLNLDLEQVESSPSMDVSAPISRGRNIDPGQYYGWPPDWMEGEHAVTPIGEFSGEPENEDGEETEEWQRGQLQSLNEMIDVFEVVTNDAASGRIADVITDDEDWVVRFLAVNFRESPQRTVLMPVAQIEGVDWIEGEVSVGGSFETLLANRDYDPAKLPSQEDE
jgi:hypothetical protein